MKFENLFSQTAKPALYARSGNPFWEDEHISAQMLEAHLDPNTDAATRKPAFMDASAVWILKMLPPSAYPRLLDLGCGPGLYAQRFARMGYHVTGVDFSRRSLDYARASARKSNLAVNYLFQNYLNLSWLGEADLVTMIYCDYGALSTQERARVLATAYDYLRPGGRMLLDVFTLAEYQRFTESQSWEACPQGGFWAKEPHIALHSRFRYPPCVTLRQTTILTAGGFKTYPLWDTYFTPESLTQEIQSAGFKPVSFFGDVAGAPYADTSSTLAMIFEKPDD